MDQVYNGSASLTSNYSQQVDQDKWQLPTFPCFEEVHHSFVFCRPRNIEIVVWEWLLVHFCGVLQNSTGFLFLSFDKKPSHGFWNKPGFKTLQSYYFYLQAFPYPTVLHFGVVASPHCKPAVTNCFMWGWWWWWWWWWWGWGCMMMIMMMMMMDFHHWFPAQGAMKCKQGIRILLLLCNKISCC